jgi:hypothetical protein
MNTFDVSNETAPFCERFSFNIAREGPNLVMNFQTMSCQENKISFANLTPSFSSSQYAMRLTLVYVEQCAAFKLNPALQAIKT